MQLTNRTILITGGTSGIGFALAAELIERGNRVIICGRDRAKLVRAAEALPKVVAHECDVSKEEDLRSLAGTMERDVASLDMLINNAGIMRFFDATKETSDLSGFEREIATNLLAPIRLTELLLPLLMRQKESAVVNVSSGLAYAQIAAAPVYCATKAALHSWSRSLRLQLRETSVRVIEVLPPRVASELGEGRKDARSDPRQMPADVYARKVLRAMEHDDLEINAGGTQWFKLISRVAQGPLERMLWKMTQRLVK